MFVSDIIGDPKKAIINHLFNSTDWYNYEIEQGPDTVPTVRLEGCMRRSNMVYTSTGTGSDSSTDVAIYNSPSKLYLAVSLIKRVIFHNPATIVYWQDGSKTVVKCKADERYDKEKGLAMCLAKKLLGTEFHSTFKEWCKDAD